MTRWPLSGARAYAAAMAGVLVATAARLALEPLLQGSYPYLTYLVALLLTAWTCGLGPAALALAVGAVTATVVVPLPREPGSPPEVARLTGLVLYLIIGAIGVAINASERRSRRRAEDARSMRDALLNSAPVGMALVDTDLRYLTINAALARMNGLPVADHLGRPVAEVVPGIWPALEPVYRRVLATGEPDLGREVAGASVWWDSGVRTVLTNTYPVRAEGRGIIGIGVAVLDITERQRAETAVAAVHQQFHDLADAIPQIAYITDADGQLRYINRRWTEYTGLDATASLDRDRRLETVHPDDRARMTAAWARSFTTGADFEQQLRLRRGSDGAYRWFLSRAVPVRDDAGRVVQWFGTSTDIEDQKQAEEALRRGEETLRLQNAKIRRLVDSNILGVAFAEQGRIVEANDAFLAMIEADRAAVEAGRIHWRLLTPPEHVAADARAFAELRDRGACTPYQKELLRPDGGRVPILTAGARIDPEARSWVCFAQDMTPIKRVERELRDADRRKDEFLAMLAHELRNPLAPIRNAVSVLATEPAAPDPDPGDARPWAHEVIDRQLRHLTRLVDDLLDVSRITQGKISLTRAPVAVAEIVRSAIEASRPLIESRGHALELDVPAADLWVDGDPTRLAQVVLNLLNNAAKYTRPGGRIRVAAAREADRVAIRVSDSGDGIPADMLPRIFDLFTQVDRSIDRAEGGLGIGLTLVQRLVCLHGGTVAARSDGPGTGSEFVVHLPLRPGGPPPAARPPVAAAAAAATAVPGKPRRVLIIDDNRDAAATLARLLRRLGHDAETAPDGPSGLAAALARPPDLVLLDIGLPGMDGYEVARRLRAEPSLDGVTLVALTGYGAPSDRRRSREAGLDDHLVKPVELDALRQILDLGPIPLRSGG